MTNHKIDARVWMHCDEVKRLAERAIKLATEAEAFYNPMIEAVEALRESELAEAAFWLEQRRRDVLRFGMAIERFPHQNLFPFQGMPWHGVPHKSEALIALCDRAHDNLILIDQETSGWLGRVTQESHYQMAAYIEGRRLSWEKMRDRYREDLEKLKAEPEPEDFNAKVDEMRRLQKKSWLQQLFG